MSKVSQKIIALVACVGLLCVLAVVAIASDVELISNGTAAESDAVVKSEAVVKSDAATESDAVVKSDAVAENDAIVKSDAAAESDAVVKSDAVVESDANVNVPVVDETPVADETPAVAATITADQLVACNKSIQVNGKDVELTDVGVKEVVVDPVTGGTITYVPLRLVAENLKCAVAWRQNDSTVHIFKNGKSYMFTINSNKVKVNDFQVGTKFVYTTDGYETIVEKDYPNVVPVLEVEAGRTLVPLRAIANLLNATPDYDEQTNMITIVDNDEAMANYVLTIADLKAKNMIDTHGYVPPVKYITGSVEVSVYANFAGADQAICDGIVVKILDKSATTANAKCDFADLKEGTYTLVVENVPAGYEISSDLNVVVEAGKTVPKKINIVPVVAETPAE